MYKLTLPTNCPLPGSVETEIILFRIIKSEKISPLDFRTYIELFPNNSVWKDECRAYAISLFDSIEKATKIAKKKSLGEYIAKLKIKPHHGKILIKNNHASLWLFEKCDVTTIKCLEVTKIIENS